MGDFTKLFVWQEAKELAIKLYQISNREPLSKDFGFRDQLRKAVISISNNIAEGDELQTNKQSNRHFYIAKGSCAEVRSMILIGKELGYFDGVDVSEIEKQSLKISGMLGRLIQKRKTVF